MKCPCGLTNTFENCCYKIINGKPATTAEQLMRSRYSAYVTNNAQYLFDTYADTSRKETSVADIAQWAKQCKWIALSVISAHTNTNSTIVEFSAKYLQKSKLCLLHEQSRFIKTNGRWYYLDGDIISHKELSKIKSNNLCPCDSNRKFKKCCGTNIN